MTSSDDFPSDMDRFPFDDSDADAVFGASAGSDAAPEELRDVADLVFAARRAGSADELAGEDVIVAQIAAAVGEHVASPLGDTHERIRVLKKLRTAKLTAAATAVLMLGGTAAAAATGSLPISAPAHHTSELAAKHFAPAAQVKAQHHEGRKRTHGASGTVASPADAPHTRDVVGGAVASVNGVSDPGTCGTSGPAGTFTLTSRHGKTFTVNVDTTTSYVDKGVVSPTFVNVCVGSMVLTKGAFADTTVTATDVYIAPAGQNEEHDKTRRHGVFGTVASVKGVSDAGTCGTAGGTGSITLTKDDQTFTVNIDGSTTFFAPGGTTPSFADVCVGSKVGAAGDVSGTTVTATQLFVLPAHTHEHDGKNHDGNNNDEQRHDGTHDEKAHDSTHDVAKFAHDSAPTSTDHGSSSHDGGNSSAHGHGD